MRSAGLALAAVVAIAGCKGDDGRDGVNGMDAPTPVVESCAGCHNAGLPTTHATARTNQVAISNKVITVAASLDAVPVADADLVITFNVKVDGINRNDFTHLATVTQWSFNAGVGAGTRTRYRPTENAATFATFTVTPNFNGNYTVRLPAFGPAGAAPAPQDTLFMLHLDTGNSQPQATVILQYAIVAAPPVVSNQACMNCHGSFVWRALDANGVPVGHFGANPIGVEGCIVCHDRDDTAETRLGVNGTRLRGYVHGIHNSHNMPGATKLDGTPVAGGVYYRNGGASNQFSIGFPGYMNNCSTCHDTPAALAAVASAPVSWQVCMSCHIGPPVRVTPGAAADEVAPGFAWAGFGVANTGNAATPVFAFGGVNHANYTAATPQATCAGCHDDVTAPSTLAGFHNGLLTERRGLIWDGADQSVIEGARFDVQITGVTITGGNLSITWTADVDGAPVDPCNSDLTAGPVFFGLTANAATGQAASNFSVIRSYAQANDWVNDGVQGGTAPGQPAGSVTLTATNTTCSVNVATTNVGAVQTVNGTKGVVGLQGKPQIRFTPGIGTTSEVIQVRAKSATREFLVADGAAPAAADLRRVNVTIDNCKACHKGSVYQHGGNRVDAIELCVMCHNPAANEKNNRVNMGVDATEAYDGKASETYDLRTMVHAIHSAGETDRALVYYRTNGIYFFGSKAALAKVASWPGTGCQVVAGSGAPSSATGTQCDPTNTTQVTKTHNFIEVHYPQPLSNCTTCHVNDSDKAMPNPARSVAVTFDAGGTTYNDLLDDVLIGPMAQSCMTCHQSGDPAIQFGLREHAYDNGWTPTTFPNGRQTLLDAVAP